MNFILPCTHLKREFLTDHEQYLFNLNTPKLDEDEWLMLEENLVIDEVIESIKSMKNGKCPGYKKIITNILWGNKPSKIRYDRAIQNYANLGLKWVNLQSKDKALKATLVLKAIIREDHPLYFHLPIKQRIIWDCNVKPELM